MKIAIIDIIGIPYDGTTVFKQGLGGSESAVTFAARELAKIGFSVTVFNNCDCGHAKPGVYDQVVYCPLSKLAQDHYFDIVVSSRTVIPFTDDKDYARLGDKRSQPFAGMKLYDRILARAERRVLWMHDTFCLGDNIIEELAVGNRITDIFTLSDWHLTYVSNCNHGRRRNFEVLKNKMFITRNGVNIYHQEVDLKAKDPNLFVYNASVTKGMIPLVKQVWPHVKRHIPAAKLKVIGGYYRFSETSGPDQQEKDWRAMAADPELAKLGIEFTGVISQKEIADILVQANFMLYPSAFPETFGISSLESICYNTPIVACRFGALEEIALESACYLIDYAIEPNSLFPDIDVPRQLEEFVKTTVLAHRNPYLHQQKQNYCNIVKDIVGWDTVALQWKQYFYQKTDRYLSRDEYRRVTNINRRWHKIFKRRYHNTVELENYKSGHEQEIVVITTFYNCEQYIERCIESVAAQDYDNYQHILIDDASTDGTVEQIKAKLSSLPTDLQGKFVLISNKENVGAVKNQVDHFRKLNDDAIVMIIDGDDSLVNDNTVFAYYNTLYHQGTEFSYGSSWSMTDNIPLISQPYPDVVKKNRSYRQHHFNWILPYTHLRTFRKRLINNCHDDQFKDSNGNWFRAGGDGSIFYALIEQADPEKITVVQDVVYNYNDINPLNDYKVNGHEQNETARKIINMNSHPTQKKILIAIPTAKNIEAETFKSIYDLQVPEGYQTTFQYFYGYNIDQVRNLISNWVVNGFDYLFSVDSDIAFAPDTLTKLLAHDRDVVCGLYIQRKPGQHILEVYEPNAHGGVSNIPYGKIKGQGLVEIAGCGFGCTLVKAEVMRAIGYPQFEYHSALNHDNTISEDVDFCRKARNKGFKLWADTSILCRHIGSFTFTIDDKIPAPPPAHEPDPKVTIETRLRDLGNQRLIPQTHIDYLAKLKSLGVEPKVVYDIGACVLHWTNEAKRIWPDSEFVAFEAMDSAEFLYKEQGMKYHIGVLSNETGKEVEFYQNNWHPGGNSYYKENSDVNPESPKYFNEKHRRMLKTVTLDSVIELKNLPLPDLIKMDVQGAELDVLKGAGETIKLIDHVILELQHVEYNKGAPLKDTVIEYMNTLGFDCYGEFSTNGPDGDYHFVRR